MISDYYVSCWLFDDDDYLSLFCWVVYFVKEKRKKKTSKSFVSIRVGLNDVKHLNCFIFIFIFSKCVCVRVIYHATYHCVCFYSFSCLIYSGSVKQTKTKVFLDDIIFALWLFDHHHLDIILLSTQLFKSIDWKRERHLLKINQIILSTNQRENQESNCY